MSNDSVTRVANNGSPPSTSDMRKPLPNRVEVISEMISEMKKLGHRVPLAAMGHDANHLNGSRMRRHRPPIHRGSDRIDRHRRRQNGG
jgi:hypothetical protein